MFDEIIYRVIQVHPDFSYEEVEEVCRDYYDSIVEKIKEETKIKRTIKYIEKEFELDAKKIEKTSNKVYSIETIPEYLFNWKVEIASSLVKITNLTKNIDQTELFQDVEFQINKNDKIALIWKNGAGKTTLLKMMIWNDTEYKWMIELATGLKIGYLSQDLFWQDKKNTLREEMLLVFPEITGKVNRLKEIENDTEHWEESNSINAYLRENDGYRKYELQTEILKYFGFSDSQLDLCVLSLSGWEQTKVQIAKFIITEVDLLILDEPTNHLDIEWILFLEKFCKIWKKAILSISHDIRFINNTSDKIVEISGKKLHNYPGNYEKYLIEKQARYDRQLKAHELQKKEIEEQEAWINRFRYTPSKSASVQSRIKQIEKIEKIEKPENESIVKSITIKTEKRLPEKIMEFWELEIGYENPIIISSEEVIVHKNDKIWIIWKNGAGKTTLLKTILWEIKPISGNVYINPDLIIGSYSQVLSDLDGNNSIIEELSKDHPKDNEIRTMLGWLLISWEKVNQVITTLSGWERAKVALTKMLLASPHVIIMDEPTNHLDIHSKEAIKSMLEWFNGTTIVVSHDRDLLQSISNKVWLIEWWKLEIFNDAEEWFLRIFN